MGFASVGMVIVVDADRIVFNVKIELRPLYPQSAPRTMPWIAFFTTCKMSVSLISRFIFAIRNPRPLMFISDT